MAPARESRRVTEGEGITDKGLRTDGGVREGVEKVIPISDRIGVGVLARAIASTPVGVTIADATQPDNPLVYANPAFERITGYDRTAMLGRNCRFLQGPETDPEPVAKLREAIEAEEAVTVELRNYRPDGEPFWNRVTVAPIDDGDGRTTHYVGFQEDVTERVEAQRDLEDRTEALELLVDRIDGLLGDVTDLLMHATERESGEAAVAERIAEADPYVAAWFGEPDRITDSIVSTAWAGEGASLEELAVPRDSDDPTARAAREMELQIGPVEGTTGEAHIPAASSVAAVPLVYGETVYGVLTIYAASPTAFDGQERVVIRALGRAIGAAIHAAASQRVLTADNVVEVTVEVRDSEMVPIALAQYVDTELSFEGSVNRNDGGVSSFYSTDEPVEADVSGFDHVNVETVEILTQREGGTVIELGLSADALLPSLARRGVQTLDILADSDRAKVTIAIPPDREAGDVIDWIVEQFPSTQLLVRRERERPVGTEESSVDPETALTERQRTALQRAHVAGYFDPDRATTGQELADSMGISRSTFHQHLRAAQRKLVDDYFSD